MARVLLFYFVFLRTPPSYECKVLEIQKYKSYKNVKFLFKDDGINGNFRNDFRMGKKNLFH